jgi:hypothetical protein
MLHYVWSYPGESMAAIKQLGISIAAIFYCLLLLSFKEDTFTQKKLEATRISLLIWTWMLSQSLFNESRNNKNVMLTFSTASLDAKKKFWPSSLYFLLKEWNRAIQSSEYKSNTPDGCMSIQLIRIVQAIERETDVKLGGVMQRLFDIEVWYWTTAKSYVTSEERYQVQRQLLT